MAVSLAESKNNAQNDYDPEVIDEFRKESVVMDSLVFDDVVNPSGGGSTLTYGYRRLTTQPTAGSRALNSEYTPGNVTTTKFSTDLAVMGGSFQVDRVIAGIGPAASAAISLNLTQKIKATVTSFQDMVINGDTAVDANGFDGLDKALLGSTTEYGVGAVANWSDLDTVNTTSHKALDALDEFLALLDGTPTVLVGNQKVLAKIRAIVRRTSHYVREPVEGLIGQGNRPIYRESYGGIVFADAGNKAGTNNPIIPVATRTVATVSTTNLSDLYAYRVGLDGFCGISTVGGTLVQTWLPDFSIAGAVKTGEVELGPLAVVLKASRAAAVFRNIKVA